MGCTLQETVEDYPILKALVADFDAAVTRMTIYKQYDWSFYVIIKELIKKINFTPEHVDIYMLQVSTLSRQGSNFGGTRRHPTLTLNTAVHVLFKVKRLK